MEFSKPLATLICIAMSMSMYGTTLSNVSLDTPADHAVQQDTLSFSFQWYAATDSNGEKVTYDLYLGTGTYPALFRQGLDASVNSYIDLYGYEWIFGNQVQVNGSPVNAVYYLNYCADTLKANTTYYWKVVARNESGDSTISEVFSFTTYRENSLPTMPVLLSPSNGETDVSSTPLLQWSSSVDADGDQPRYAVMLKREGTAFVYLTTLTDTSYTITSPLADYETYYWKIQVWDGYTMESVYSSTSLFTVENYYNDPPVMGNLLSPSDGTENVGLDITLRWAAATDADDDVIHYTVFTGEDADPKTIIAQDIPSLSIEHTFSGYNTKYWKVVASDGVNSDTSEVFSFTPVTWQEPAILFSDGAVNTGRCISLSWTAATECTDIDVFYDLYIDTESSPETLMAPGLRSASYSVTLKEPNTTYYYKVVTRDTSGVLYESPVQSFTPWKNDTTGLKVTMVDVDGGAFGMGSDEYTIILPGYETWGELPVDASFPQRTITLDDYSIGKYEATYSQFLIFLEAIQDSWYIDTANNALIYKSPALHVVNGVITAADEVKLCSVKSDTAAFDFTKHSKLTWENNTLYIKSGFENYPANWLTAKGMELFADWSGYRIPTEAEWEFAARGGNNSQGYTYSGTNTVKAAGWYLWGDANYNNPMSGTTYANTLRNNKGTNIVGLKTANELGLYDMSGNVRELCSDYYDVYSYCYNEVYNPLGVISGSSHATRGGSWSDNEDALMNISRNTPSGGETGIRLAGNNTASNTVILHGIVYDEDGEALEDIKLCCEEMYASSDENGRYQFRVKKGVHTIITPLSGYYSFSPSGITLEGFDDVVTNLNFTAFLKHDVKVSGTITDMAGNVLEGITIKHDYGQTESNAEGRYTLRLPADKTFTLTINDPEYNPASTTVNVAQSDISDVDFALGYRGSVTVSGVITKGTYYFAGCIISGFDEDITTNGNGYYSVEVRKGWTGTILPLGNLETMRLFSPRSVNIENLEKDTIIDFIAYSKSTVTYEGTVVDIYGNPLPGVEIYGFGPTVLKTSCNGTFGLKYDDTWSGTIRPAFKDYTFSPATLDVYITSAGNLPAATVAYFVGTPPGDYTVSGTVKDENGILMQGVGFDGFGKETSTDLNGNYSQWIGKSTDYTIVPQLSGYTFSPEKLEVTSASASITCDFTAIKNSSAYYSVTFIVTYGSNVIPNATITFNGTSYTTGSNGEITISGMQNGTYSYSVSATGYDNLSGSVTINNADASVSVVMVLTGIENNPDDDDLRIFPVPSAGDIHILYDGEAKALIFSFSGHKIMEETFSGSLDLTLNEKGLFLVVIKSTKGISTRKIIIE